MYVVIVTRGNTPYIYGPFKDDHAARLWCMKHERDFEGLKTEIVMIYSPD